MNRSPVPFTAGACKNECDLLFLSADLKVPQGSPACHARSPSWTGPLSAVPEISCMELTSEDEFFVLACDGEHPATLPEATLPCIYTDALCMVVVFTST